MAHHWMRDLPGYREALDEARGATGALLMASSGDADAAKVYFQAIGDLLMSCATEPNRVHLLMHAFAEVAHDALQVATLSTAGTAALVGAPDGWTPTPADMLTMLRRIQEIDGESGRRDT